MKGAVSLLLSRSEGKGAKVPFLYCINNNLQINNNYAKIKDKLDIMNMYRRRET